MLCKNCGRSFTEHYWYSVNSMNISKQLCPTGNGLEWKAPGQMETLKPLGSHPASTSGGIWQGHGQSGMDIQWGSDALNLIKCSNPKFAKALTMMRDLHDKKSADYAQSGNRYSNFEEAAASSGCSVDEVFAVLIGIKMARLKELITSGKTPANESVADSKIDLANYCTLWLSYGLE